MQKLHFFAKNLEAGMNKKSNQNKLNLLKYSCRLILADTLPK